MSVTTILWTSTALQVNFLGNNTTWYEFFYVETRDSQEIQFQCQSSPIACRKASTSKAPPSFRCCLVLFLFCPHPASTTQRWEAIKGCASTTATTNKLLFLCRIGREYEKTNLRLNVDSSVKKRKISSNILKIFLQFVNFIQTCELLKRFWKSSWNSLNFRFIPKVNESSTRRKNFANRAQ